MPRSTVIGLLTLGSPSAIVRLVITVIVDAVNRVRRRRTVAHVSEEVLERVPSFADCDTSSSVISIGAIARVKTAVSQCSPSSIFSRVRSMVSPCCFGSCASTLALETSATLPKWWPGNLYNSSTVTAAKPKIPFVSAQVLRFAQYKQSPETLTIQHQQFGHFGSLYTVTAKP